MKPHWPQTDLRPQTTEVGTAAHSGLVVRRERML